MTARVSIILFMLCAVVLAVRAQTLQITSPVSGTVVNPGQTVPITVTATGGDFLTVAVVSTDNFPEPELPYAPPYTASVQVPTDLPLGKYYITALGAIVPGSPINSDSVMIDVELPDAPVSLTVQPAAMGLRIGDVGNIGDIIATFNDQSTLDVFGSTQVTFQSDTPSVATVDAYGIVTAITPGVANINVSYGNLSFPVSVGVWQPVVVVPSTDVVNASQSVQFGAQLAMPDGTDTSVTWSIQPIVGSIDGTGLYSAPSSVSAETRVVVTASSVANQSWSGSAELLVLPPPSVSITPSSASLTAGLTQEFSATVTNTLDQMVNWSVTPSGSLTLAAWDGYNPIYTAPATITSPQTVTITATRQADPSNSASVPITLVPSVALSVSPATTTLYANQSQQFSATINYTSGASVTWSLSPMVGTVNASGLYTAPSTIPYQQTITVVATASGGYTATATVTLVPLASSGIPAPTGLTAVAASASEIDLSWNASQNGSIAGYSIFRNSTPVGTSTGTTYADLGLLQSTTYSYTVAAYDTQGNISAPSASASATTLPSSTPGLVASFNLNEGTGTIAYDSSGNGNNGVIAGATWTTGGRLTNALQFNGTNNWVTVQDSNSLDVTTQLTMEAWMNATSLGDWQALIVKEQVQDLCYGLFADNSWPAANLFVGSEQVAYGNQNIPFNTWTHVAVTYDGTNQSLYVNGALARQHDPVMPESDYRATYYRANHRVAGSGGD